jgi:hypothetical protein
VRGSRRTFGGRGRSEKSVGRDGAAGVSEGVSEGVGVAAVGGAVAASTVGGTGDVAREMLAGVWGAEGRGLFLDRGRDGACRKSSGMSFQLSIVRGLRVVGGALPFKAMRGGAEIDLGGGGGRRGAGDAAGGGFVGAASCLLVLGFLSQLLRDDCNMAGDVAGMVVVRVRWVDCAEISCLDSGVCRKQGNECMLFVVVAAWSPLKDRY